MKTFYIKFEVVPTEHNPHYSSLKAGYASCWIREQSKPTAFNKAYFFVAKDEWKIVGNEQPIEVSRSNFVGREEGLAQFEKAQENEIAIVYVGVARDGKTETGMMPFISPKQVDLNTYVGQQKKLTNKGRCLHFESGTQCGSIISAHSIQENGQLSAIASNGHVFAMSRNIGDLKKNDGRLTLERYGIGKVSTFLGFCDKHDNLLFAPIDKQPLRPTHEQAILYAYRSLCRELFVKENALTFFEAQSADIPASSTIRIYFERMRDGTAYGLENLRRHKAAFDQSLNNKTFEDVEYVLFTSSQTPNMAFSGLLYPEFDFLGQPLQNLADQQRQTDLITFSSATIKDGWGLLFAWHKSSSQTCSEFMRSLGIACYNNSSNGGDETFRLVVSNCENLAISPTWWECLPVDQQNSVTARMSHSADFFTATPADYLTTGLDTISGWAFERVVSEFK